MQHHVSRKEMSISLHRCRQNGLSEPSDAEPKSICSSLGAFREAPGASWGLPGPHGKLVGSLSESPGIFIVSLGTVWGLSWGLLRLSCGSGCTNGVESNSFRQGRCRMLLRASCVPCIVIIPVWREGGWENICQYENIQRNTYIYVYI